MGQARPLLSPDLEVYEAVFSTLSAYHPHDVISTKRAIDQVRSRYPRCEQTDEEIVGLLVTALSGRTIAMSFDHKATG